MVKDLAMWLIALNLLGILVCMFPTALGPQADPLVARTGRHPPGMVLHVPVPGAEGAGAVVARHGGRDRWGIVLFGLGGLVWAWCRWPTLPANTAAGRKVGTWIGIVALAGTGGIDASGDTWRFEGNLLMNYPVWDVPHLGSGWVIGIIAIFHVMISQFAVGGGLYLPVAEYRA